MATNSISNKASENFKNFGTTLKDYDPATDADLVFVDLGLPSGKKWAFRAVPGYWSLDKAKEVFGDRLPSMKDWQELFEHTDKRLCTETMELFLTNRENKRYIVLPVSGALKNDGERWDLDVIARFGNCWSSDECPEVDGKKQWYAYFIDDRIRFGAMNRDCGQNVTLVIE